MNKKTNLKLFFRFLQYHKPYLKWEILTVVLTVISILATLPGPLIIKSIIDTAIKSKSFSLLSILISVLVALFLTQKIVGFFINYILINIRKDLISNIRSQLYDHLQNLSVSFHIRKQSGHLISRVLSDVDTLSGLLADNLTALFKNSIFVVSIAVLFVMLNWKLASLFLTTIPLFIFVLIFFNGFLNRASLKVQKKIEQFTGNLGENIAGIRLIKAFSKEKERSLQIKQKIKEVEEGKTRRDLLGTIFRLVSGTIIALGTLIIWWYGGIEAIKGNLSIGTLVAFNLYLNYLYGPLSGLFVSNVEIQTSLAAAERIFEILDLTPETKEREKAVPLPLHFNSNIQFKDVSFGYSHDKLILKNISFLAEEGQKIAFVGATGMGKTTLVNLILRFYEPLEGNIFIGKYDIQDLILQSLRSKISIVSQETFLFDGSVSNNIAFGKIDATKDEIINAARVAGAHEFISNLPGGYEATVGEKGIKLSGGQRQLVSIARAVLRDPTILLLDEPTAFLDSVSERNVCRSLKSLMENRTVIIISHRLGTILFADKIFVLQGGQIVERGTHKELSKENTIYNSLFPSPLPKA